MRWSIAAVLAAASGIGGTVAAVGVEHASASPHHGSGSPAPAGQPAGSTATPIKHVVVIFQENVSFDHYFGTYPNAANTSGERFPAPRRPLSVNNLADTPGLNGVGTLLTNNPNTDATGKQVNPRRLDPANINDILTCDQDHGYADEQKAFDGGKMDKFVTTVGNGSGKSPTGQPCQPSDVMNYYDGNTVTGLWNYARHFALSDNSFGTTFGPSSPGAINLVSGNTGNVGLRINGAATNGDTVSDGNGGYSVISDPQPYFDDCSTRDAVSLTGKNIGDELTSAGLSWGWFQGGFRPTTSFAAATAGQPTTSQPTSSFTPDEFKGKFVAPPASDQGLCNAVHPVGAALGGIGGTQPGPNNYGNKDDYIAHHEPFQYYLSTANPHHLPPTSLAAIGTDGQTFVNGTPQFDTANHQYDTSDFNSLVAAIARGYISSDHLPAVSFLKAPGYEDGHAGYSDPIDEQRFVTNEINALQHTPDWSSTAVVIAYDDSDGYYDHAFSGVHNPSNTSAVPTPPGPQDFLNGLGICGSGMPLAGQNGRCGYGPRLPLLVISPFAKRDHVDHTLTDLSSITKFVEDNWQLSRINGSFDTIAGSLNGLFNFGSSVGDDSKLFLDPVTGRRASGRHRDVKRRG
ncbi:MAG: phospholipase C [Solirubrobacteraceae bacterium]